MTAPTMELSQYFEGRVADDAAVKELVGLFNAPLVKDIPRGMLKVQTPGAHVNTAPFRAIWGFGLLVILDLAMHAGAGAAAASVGAKGNGLPVTTRALQLGALAAITKAAMTTFREVVLMAKVNFAFTVLIFLLSSSFGICPLLVTEVGNLSLGEAPKELLIAAVVAAIPLFFDTIRDIEPKPDDEGKTNYLRWGYAVFLIPTDALGGYVFARMAANQGMPISNYSAACSAGAVFGTLTFLSRAMTGCIAMINFTTATGGKSNIFGVWEFIVPEPVVMSRDEYQKLQDGVTNVVSGAFKMGPKMAMRPIKLLARLASCCCPCFNVDFRKAFKDVEQDFDEMQEGMPSDMVAMSAMFMAQGLIGRVVGVGDGPGDGGHVSSASSQQSVQGQITGGSSDHISSHEAGQVLTAPLQSIASPASEQKIDTHLAAQIGGSSAT
ncbi:hypothetical protein QBC39DRAFT_364127 [Podospora conica]|nr:hypothetical protein QBC39DRAFT_364127 [Schizothecium conicum]